MASGSNVYSYSKVISSNKEEDQGSTVQNYELGTFSGGNQQSQTPEMRDVAKLNDQSINGNVDPVLLEVQKLAQQMQMIQQKVVNIENNGVSGRDLDRQVVEAIKDLKNYAQFFEQATFQVQTRILDTSVKIAQKIIDIEIGENSAKIAKETINNLLGKIKTASKITIHLNPKDYAILKNELQFESYIDIQEDVNVTAGGVVIASDLGNFDGSIEAKVSSMLEHLSL
jgi:flagellar assembly protein FliH